MNRLPSLSSNRAAPYDSVRVFDLCHVESQTLCYLSFGIQRHSAIPLVMRQSEVCQSVTNRIYYLAVINQKERI